MEPDKVHATRTSFVLLERYRQGDDAAADALFTRYFQRLTLLARSRLSTRLARRTDPEDVVLSAYRSFFIDARAGRFTWSRGGDLWRLLAAITRHKLLRQARHHGADRRAVNLETPLDQAEEGGYFIRDREPSPEDAVALADEVEWIHSRLDPFGRRVLELRMQGEDLSEIGADTGRSERTVRRALARIRELLGERLGDDDPRAKPVGPNSPEPDPAAPPTPMDQATIDPDVPHVALDDVLLRRMIGSGRTGKVYEAWRRSEGRAVAVKFLRKSFWREPGIVGRFVAEAGIVAMLRHPNIVAVHGLGRTPAGAPFIVMDLVAGPSLDTVAHADPVPVPVAVRWTTEACNALEHAHAKGVIHCDLKPANLLLDRDGSLRVADFGLARSLTGRTPWTTEVEGTAPFMAPEQVSRSWGPIDERTDVYGIGAVLFAFLTGRPPWTGRRLPDILALLVSTAPVIAPADLRPDVPPALGEVCRKCLSKRPEARYGSIREVRTALARSLDPNHLKGVGTLRAYLDRRFCRVGRVFEAHRRSESARPTGIGSKPPARPLKTIM